MSEIQKNKLNSNPPRAANRSHNTTNEAFNDFLKLIKSDQKLLLHYHSALIEDGHTFTKIFYDFLFESSITAKFLKKYEEQGGVINDLVTSQLQHLFGLLSGNIDNVSAQRMAYIGKIHQRHGIQPVWIMGAYKLYLDYLQNKIRSHTEIKDCDRATLEDTVTKLIFRDMGLMLEGYWEFNLQLFSEEKEKVTDLRDQMTSLLTNIPQTLWSIDVINNKLLYVSPNIEDIHEIDVDPPIPCLNWTVAEDKEKVKDAWKTALSGQTIEIESRVKTPSGQDGWFRRSFYPYKNALGAVTRIDGFMEDTTAAKESLEKLNTLATTDSLTGLINRTLFYDRLTQAITSANRNGDHQIATILMDLNNFKEINDTLGHSAGDKVLIEVGKRLQTVLRETDSLARLGGDEFGILLLQVDDPYHAAKKIANKIQHVFTDPYYINNTELFIGASIGISLYPQHGNDVATLMSRADVAMYSAKRAEDSYRFYQAKLDPNSQQKLLLSNDLRHALVRNEFVLYYQPKIDLRTNKITGAEALIRWKHPKRGVISPDEFIPLAERTGLIKPITNWVIETAIRQCKVWHDAGNNLKVAVNVSARSFHKTGSLVDTIDSLLQRFDLPKNCLEIEITENILMTDINNTSILLDKINDLGVSIAIDDFGTGYSSLAYLKKLPLDTLKIDKSFVMDMATDDNDATIVRSTIDLAHNLGLSVVAEGIENIETLNLLIKLGCEGAQGYYFSMPQSADNFLTQLQHFNGQADSNDQRLNNN